jgi:hypothetical protein
MFMYEHDDRMAPRVTTMATPLLSLRTAVLITGVLAHSLDSLVRVSRRVGGQAPSHDLCADRRTLVALHTRPSFD